MTSILQSIRNMFSKIDLIPAGIYHYLSPQDDPRNYRLHLRVHPDGSGVLILNAATVIHLNQTATEYAYYLVKNYPIEKAVTSMVRRYDVTPDQAKQDYKNFIERIQILINTPDLDPVTFLDFDRRQPFAGHISAPYRLDCALTYQLPESAAPESAPRERVTRELTTEEWKNIIDKAWSIGIPQLTFTGGEPTLRDDLTQLLEHADRNGQVTGLLSDGMRLADQNYLDKLLQTGLDHLLLVLNTEKDINWQALHNVVDADLFVAVHLTIASDEPEPTLDLIDKLAGIGIKAFSLSTNDLKRKPILETARNHLAERNLDLVWNLPVPYSAMNPIWLETGEEQVGAGKAWMYVEPDGDVFPTQGSERKLGNLINDPWQTIWHQAFAS